MAHPLVPLASRSEYNVLERVRCHPPCGGRPRRPSRGISRPYDASGGEQRPTPGLPTRLCGVFRLSQPLDASFRSEPLRPCLMPVASMGFSLQRVSLRGSERRLPATLALHAVLRSTLRPSAAASRIYASVESVALRRCYPVSSARSAPDVPPSEVFTSSDSAAGVTPQPPFLGFSTTPDGRNRPSSCLLCKVSENRRGRWPSFEDSFPPWGLRSIPRTPQAVIVAWDPDRRR
jgi:hypothetical protein